MITALSNRRVRDLILEIEGELSKFPQANLPVRHHFSNGVYVREMFIPAGTILTGKIHLTEHLFTIACGDMSLASELGSFRVRGPWTAVSMPGAKRIGFAHSDTTCMTIHATNETDVKKLESELVVSTYEELFALPRFKEFKEIEQCHL